MTFPFQINNTVEKSLWRYFTVGFFTNICHVIMIDYVCNKLFFSGK
jgi:hypothetical protein